MNRQIPTEEGLKRFFEGRPVNLMISETGRFEDFRAVNARKYLLALLGGERMMFFEAEEEKPEHLRHDPLLQELLRKTEAAKVQKKRGKVDGDLFDKICAEIDAKGEATPEDILRLSDAIVIPEWDEGERA